MRDNSSRQQGVADLRINNEALLCMLERERQHSHQLEQRLQQVEADALEVSCLLVGKGKARKDYTFWRQFHEKPSIIPGCLGSFCLQRTSFLA